MSGCFKCGESGHFARECSKLPSEPPSRGRGGRGGFSRGRGGYGGNRGNACFKCGEIGHLIRDCPLSRLPPGSGVRCYNCKEIGHTLRDCPELATQ